MNNRFKFRIWDGYSFEYNPTLDGLKENYDITDFSDLEEHKELILQQYTGYEDADGQRIYEGDILKNLATHKYSPNIFIVKWGEFEPSDDMGVGGAGFVLPWFYCRFNPKVIGNIFQNPELLK